MESNFIGYAILLSVMTIGAAVVGIKFCALGHRIRRQGKVIESLLDELGLKIDLIGDKRVWFAGTPKWLEEVGYLRVQFSRLMDHFGLQEEHIRSVPAKTVIQKIKAKK